MRSFILIIAIALLSACASVRDHRELSQPQKQKITASIGSSLFQLTKKGDLPNAVGGRDIYGGKVDRGFAEVKLVAIREEGLVDLLVFDESRASTETTMDRYGRRPAVAVSQTVNVGASGSSGGIPVTVDTTAEKEYLLAGVKITFLEVRRSSVVFTIEDTLAAK